MKKREVIEYIAFDGKVFDDELKCKEYEQYHNLREAAEQQLREVLSEIKEILKDHDMHLEVSEDYVNDILICFDEHFDDLGVGL